MSDNEYIYTEASVRFSPVNLAYLVTGDERYTLKKAKIGVTLGLREPWVKLEAAGDIRPGAEEDLQCLLPGVEPINLRLDALTANAISPTHDGTLLNLRCATPDDRAKLMRWIRSLSDHLVGTLQ